MIVSILTPSIPERARMLEECRLSVAAQTVPPTVYEHLIHIDAERKGCSWSMNHLAGQAQGRWLLPLADDDLLLPGALSALLSHSDEGDIVYAPPALFGSISWHFFQDPPLIPSFALIRRNLWFELGGYQEGVTREEDRRMWEAAMDRGARFVKVNYPCYVYRLHAGNKSFNGGVAS